MTAASAALLEALSKDGIDTSVEDSLPIARPASEEQTVELVRRAIRDRLRVVPMGSGTKLAACRPDAVGTGAGDWDFALSTARLQDVVAYEPGDGTVTAQAGVRMADLARTVAACGHRLTPDVAHPERATLGGELGSALSGPDRLRFGPVRHHVLGMRVIGGDGKVTKTGGRLVKNVTGFDLHRLYTGSRGTLCVTLDASLRLFAAFEHDAALSATFSDARGALEAVAGIRDLSITPLAVTLEDVLEETGTRVHVFLAGRAAQVAWEIGEVRTALGPAELREGDEARTHRELVRDLESPSGQRAAFRLFALPSQVASAIESTSDLARARGFPPRFLAQPGVAQVDVILPEGAADDVAHLVDFARELRELLAPAEVRLDPLGVPCEVHAALVRTASDAPALRWMNQLRAAMDPGGVFRSAIFPGDA